MIGFAGRVLLCLFSWHEQKITKNVVSSGSFKELIWEKFIVKTHSREYVFQLSLFIAVSEFNNLCLLLELGSYWGTPQIVQLNTISFSFMDYMRDAVFYQGPLFI